jgi:transcriptional regulator with XRE-family HTH domain
MIVQRKERLKEVYEYLRRHYGIHTQIDFANAINLTRPAISSAMNGNESYLTDNLFKRICAAYQGVFNLDYLLTGNGELLLEHQEPEQHTSEPIDHSSLVNALLASKDETIASHQRTIAALEQQISTDQQLITSLRQQIEYLKTHTQILDYPFNIGVADNSTPNPDQV